MVLRTRSMLIGFGLVLSLAGCSGTDRPETVPVSGVVTLDGKPLEGARVNFMAPGAPRAATGNTDSQGSFQLTTFEENDGAVPGRHTVTITKTEVSEGAEPMDASNPGEAYDAAMRGAAAAKPGKGQIPAKYSDPSKSQLEAEVDLNKENQFTFDLQS